MPNYNIKSKHLIMSKLNYILVLLLVFSVACSPGDMAETQGSDGSFETKQIRTEYEVIKLSKVVGGFEHPWAVAFLPDGRKLITERPGRLNIVDGDEVTVVAGTPEVLARNQGGMLDVSLHPNYEENGWVYLSYSKPNEDGDTALAVVRGRLANGAFTDQEEIFVMNRFASPGRHYGSKFAWDNEGYLYVSVGDFGANPPRAQDLGDHAGTLLRLYDDGSVPSDNPFVGHDGAAPEIFSYGHRNIQGLIINPENNEIWGTEHGPRGGDELNFIEAGKNYGWPTASLGRDYGDETRFHAGTEARSIDGMIDPVYEFLPTLAPSGLALVTADNFPNWKGNLLAGGLRAERIRRLYIEDKAVIHDEELLLGEVGRIRDVREGLDGNIYVLTDEDPGALYVIEPADN